MAKVYENEDYSGINIEKAKEILKLEDVYDKQIFRARIRAKHREERIKARMARKGITKEDMETNEDEGKSSFEPVAKLGESRDDSNDGGDSSDYEPDLSWLPDPDKIYRQEEENSGDDTDTFIPIPIEPKPSRKKAKGNKNVKASKKRTLENTEESFGVDEEKDSHIQSSNTEKKRKKKKTILDSIDSSLLEELALHLLKK
jgi:ATP-dependent RNA helicase DDX10/DBP4